uniref:ATP synthase F0 subunit 8 n=1 Tax=Dinothenarus chrysocomus TaxID=2977781 RepID=UPI0021CCFC2F|nr:ATP synthase F0 subunit 8 [Dinothenarus chrysocomus]UWM92615.1 ATP synthase F0 subunit 8 [Dinothenarus chrysocomus]
MPQMAPLNWLILFIMFTIIFLMFNCLNYFSFSYKNKPLTFSKFKNKINWKW